MKARLPATKPPAPPAPRREPGAPPDPVAPAKPVGATSDRPVRMRPADTGVGAACEAPTRAKRRAMSEHDKQRRRQTILDAALESLLDTPFEQITVAQLAERLGLAKGTLYLYFPTKEALFLEVQQQQLTLWFDRLEAALRKAQTVTAHELAELICATIFAQPVMPRLLTVLHSVLERNIAHDQALAFKLFIYDRFQRAAALLESALPALGSGPHRELERRFPPATALTPEPPPGARRGQGIELLLRLHALLIGTWQMTDYSCVVKEALAARPELAILELSFEKVLRETLGALIAGMALPAALAPAEAADGSEGPAAGT